MNANRLLSCDNEPSQWKKEIDLRSGVEGIPCEVTWPVCMSVMHTDRVYLFFVTFDSVRSTNVISEDPSLRLFRLANETVKRHSTVKGKVHVCKIPVD